MTFSEALKPSLIKADLENTDKLGVFNEMVQLLVDNYPQLDKEVLLSSILEIAPPINPFLFLFLGHLPSESLFCFLIYRILRKYSYCI